MFGLNIPEVADAVPVSCDVCGRTADVLDEYVFCVWDEDSDGGVAVIHRVCEPCEYAAVVHGLEKLS